MSIHAVKNVNRKLLNVDIQLVIMILGDVLYTKLKGKYERRKI